VAGCVVTRPTSRCCGGSVARPWLRARGSEAFQGAGSIKSYVTLPSRLCKKLRLVSLSILYDLTIYTILHTPPHARARARSGSTSVAIVQNVIWKRYQGLSSIVALTAFLQSNGPLHLQHDGVR